MARVKEPATDGLGLSHTQQVGHACAASPSQQCCETLFSMVKKITTDTKSQPGRGKEGHVCPNYSVYQQHHGIRNTLCGLLATKINIFKKEGTTCHN